MLELKSDLIHARFTTLGARLVALDFAGADCVMGGGNDADIMAGDWTTGAVPGRIAGRIANARIAIDGTLPSVSAHWLPFQLAVKSREAMLLVRLASASLGTR